MSATSHARRFLPFVVTAAILVYLLGNIDLSQALDALTLRAALILLPAILVWGALSLGVEGLSLARLSESAGRDTDVATCARIKAASYTLGALNYAVGVATLIFLFRRRVGLSLSAATGMVATVSFFDLGMLLSVAAISAAFASGKGPALQAGAVVLVIGGLLGGLVFLRAPVSLGPLERVRELELFRTARRAPLSLLAELAALRTLFVFLFIAAGAASLTAFDVSIPPGDLIVGLSVISVVGALPIAVAGLGTVQLATVELFAAYADKPTLVACSLSMQAAMIVVRVGTGLLFAREFTHEAAEATRGESE